MVNREFEKQALEAIRIIRDWNKLRLIQKLRRTTQRPSQPDYRLANVWITQHDTFYIDKETNSQHKKPSDTHLQKGSRGTEDEEEQVSNPNEPTIADTNDINYTQGEQE